MTPPTDAQLHTRLTFARDALNAIAEGLRQNFIDHTHSPSKKLILETATELNLLAEIYGHAAKKFRPRTNKPRPLVRVQ